MNERQAFMQAILEGPEDDFPRLQYADWLDERGDPLGEFIRVQIRLHNEGKFDIYNGDLPCERMYERKDPLTGKLYLRCYELVKAYGKEWLASLNPKAVPDVLSVKGWSRGFPSWILVKFKYWLAAAPRLTQVTPLEKVTISDKIRLRDFRNHGYHWMPEDYNLGFSGQGLRMRILHKYWPGIKFA